MPGLKCAQFNLTSDTDAETWTRDGFMFELGAGTPGVWVTAAASRDGGAWLADSSATSTAA